ncbi:MAG: SCO family protein [Anaerolineales bacterium]
MKQSSKIYWWAIPIIIGLVVVLASALLFQKPYTFHGSRFEPPLPASDFELRQVDGRPFHLSDQKGKIVLLYFGYTSCPDVCPASLANYQQIHEQLGDKADEVEFVMVTVDPERDTPEKIARYVSAFNPAFVGLSGSADELKSIWGAYGVYVEKEDSGSSAGYLVSHTSHIFVIDQDGNLALTFPFGMTAEDMAGDIQHLLG